MFFKVRAAKGFVGHGGHRSMSSHVTQSHQSQARAKEGLKCLTFIDRFFHRMQRNWCDECRDEPESGLSILACLSPFFPPTYPQGCNSSNAVRAHAVFIWNVWELQLPTNPNGSVAIVSPFLHCPRQIAGL
jgi:hypothetical protein